MSELEEPLPTPEPFTAEHQARINELLKAVDSHTFIMLRARNVAEATHTREGYDLLRAQYLAANNELFELNARKNASFQQ